MTSRYPKMFAELQEQRRLAWIPFVMLGYPSLDKSFEYIQLLIENGADALEIGIPFSDPVADGSVIQDAARIALEQGTTVAQCIKLLAKVRQHNPETPIGLLVYANLVYKPGIEAFYSTLAEAGVDSILVADLPLQEGERFSKPAKAVGISQVFIAPPNASTETIIKLVEQCEGYTYVVSRPGVTGNHQQVEYPVEVLNNLKKLGAPPAVLGFGISKPEHVAQAVEAGFDGVISGTAVVRIMGMDEELSSKALADFSQSMRQACQRTSE